jgi:Zn finger protein HypA/HybF involved in hydrogenase expression
MQNKKFYCQQCDHTFERVAGEAVLSAVCPGCGRLAKLVRFEMDLGLTFEQAVLGIFAGYVFYRLLTK